MSAAVTSLNTLAEPVVEWAWSIAWQWTLLVLLVALPAQWLLRNHSPALRYWVWQIVLLKLLLMPGWTCTLPVTWLPSESKPLLEAPAATRASGPPVDEVAVAELPSRMTNPPAMPVIAEPEILAKGPAVHLTWQASVLIGWGGLALFQVASLARQHQRLSRLLRAARPADDCLQVAVGEAATVLQLRDSPRVLVTPEKASPFVCGSIWPVLVLPIGLTESLTPFQVRQILLHELAHVRRRDLLWGWFPQGVQMLWWFHPVVHLVVYRLRLERELACDQLAMTLSGRDAAAYAQALVDVVTQTSTLADLSPVVSALNQPAATAADRVPAMGEVAPHGHPSLCSTASLAKESKQYPT